MPRRRMKRIGSLWQRKLQKNGKESAEDYLIGHITFYVAQIQVVIFYNHHKTTPKAPDWTMYAIGEKGPHVSTLNRKGMKKIGSLWYRPIKNKLKQNTHDKFLVGNLHHFGATIRISIYFSRRKSDITSPDWTIFVMKETQNTEMEDKGKWKKKV